MYQNSKDKDYNKKFVVVGVVSSLVLIGLLFYIWQSSNRSMVTPSITAPSASISVVDRMESLRLKIAEINQQFAKGLISKEQASEQILVVEERLKEEWVKLAKDKEYSIKLKSLLARKSVIMKDLREKRIDMHEVSVRMEQLSKELDQLKKESPM